MGIGSEVLKFIEQIARQYGINKIKGMLASIDFNHKDRLYHFYIKKGYKIDAAETKIEKILV